MMLALLKSQWKWLVGGAVVLIAVAASGKSVRVWPVRPRRAILSRFGASRDGGARIHAGIDLGAFKGDPIVAIDDGVVLHRVTGYGIGAGLQAVAIRHDDADYIYAEIRTDMQPGQRVSAGQQIGTADLNGDGNSMLHLEAWEHGRAPKGFTPWYGGKPPPAGLLDVGELLETINA
jgi:murein DD-endopeptidase MepM/ murein hydrolase activator NlpD